MKTYFSIEDYIEQQSREIQPLLQNIRRIVNNSHPKIQERIHYRTPFFMYNGPLCYFGIIKKTSVEIGFVRGFDLSNEQALLEAKGRIVVKGITFLDLKDFQEKEKVFREIVQEAILMNEIKTKNPFFNPSK